MIHVRLSTTEADTINALSKAIAETVSTEVQDTDAQPSIIDVATIYALATKTNSVGARPNIFAPFDEWDQDTVDTLLIAKATRTDGNAIIVRMPKNGLCQPLRDTLTHAKERHNIPYGATLATIAKEGKVMLGRAVGVDGLYLGDVEPSQADVE